MNIPGLDLKMKIIVSDLSTAKPGEIVAIGERISLSPKDSEILENQFSLPLDQKIYHYIPYKYFQVLLEKRVLSLSRLDLFTNDLTDGLLPQVNRNHMPKEGVESDDIHRRLCYAHCWNRRGLVDNMWETFAGESGVCIQSTIKRLQDALSPLSNGLFMEIGGVTYLKEGEHVPMIHSSTPRLCKSDKFAEQEEVRILVQYEMDHIPLDADGYIATMPERLELPVKLESLIETLILHKSMPYDQKDQIVSRCSFLSHDQICR